MTIALYPGDYLIIDEVEYKVLSFNPPDEYVLTICNEPAGYYSTIFKRGYDLETLNRLGRLKVGRKTGSAISSSCVWHTMQKYVGIREVYNFCKNCGEKEFIDWKTIKNDKEY